MQAFSYVPVPGPKGRRRIRSAVDFVPSVLPRVWLRADRITGLNDGDPIDTWANAGASGGSFIGIGAGRPLWRASAVNGRPAVDFDGSNDVLQTTLAGSQMISASAFEYFMVFQADIINTDDAVTLINNDCLWGDNVPNYGTFLRSAPTVHAVVNDGAAKIVSASIATGAPQRIAVRLDAGNLYLSVGAGDDSSVACGNVASTATNPRIGHVTGARFDGKLAEFLTFNTVLSDQFRNEIKNYLFGRYGA
jgi:hypothetical protein